jgi:GT2 family glycosyltransferase
MAVVDIVIATYRGIADEAQAPFQEMVMASACQCRDGRGLPMHPQNKCTKGRHAVRQSPPIKGSSVVHWARNQAIALAMYGPQPAGRPPAEYFLLMDDDMLCEPHYLNRLLSYKLPIVTGISTIRRDPPKPNIRFWSNDQARFGEPFEWDWDSQKLMEVDGVGGAFLLIRRDVLERMAEAYINCEFEIEEDLRKTSIGEAEIRAYWAKKSERRKLYLKDAIAKQDWRMMDGWWFQFLDNIDDRQIGEVGEDISFCWKAKKMGYKIMADPQVLPGHLGMYGYSAKDYRQWAESAKEVMEIPEHMLKENKPALCSDTPEANDNQFHPNFEDAKNQPPPANEEVPVSVEGA